MKRMRRHTRTVRRFNLVEIALAMAILVIGLSSIMVLFPVGVNANRSAIANNNLADVAEYLLGYFRATIMNNVYNTRNAFDDPMMLNIPDTQLTANSYDWSSATAIPNFDNLSTIGVNGLYLYEQKHTVGTETIVDFAVECRMWQQSSTEIYYRQLTDLKNETWKSNYDSITAGDTFWKGYERLVYLELSWPITQNWSEREKRVYVLDIFNPLYDLPEDGGVF